LASRRAHKGEEVQGGLFNWQKSNRRGKRLEESQFVETCLKGIHLWAASEEGLDLKKKSQSSTLCVLTKKPPGRKKKESFGGKALG